MLIFHMITFLLISRARASPKRHRGREDPEKVDPNVKWDIIPVSMMDCWRSPYSREPRLVSNWTAMEEASGKLKKWGESHKIGAGDFRGFDVGW